MSHRAVRSHRATIAMLRVNSRLWRSRGAAFKAARLERELNEAQNALSMAEDAVRCGTHRMFAIDGAGLSAGEERRHVDGPSRVEIVLTALDDPSECRLTFRQLAVAQDVSLRCCAADVNTLAELIVRGEQALFDADQTGRPIARR